MTGSKTPVFSDLYFDDTLGVTMMSCTAPMYNSLGQFIGAVTVDIEISSIQNMINDVIIGKQGFVQLLDQNGFYITNKNADKILKDNILENDDPSIKELADKIYNQKSGDGEYLLDGINYEVYFNGIDNLNWHILAQIPSSEVQEH